MSPQGVSLSVQAKEKAVSALADAYDKKQVREGSAAGSAGPPTPASIQKTVDKIVTDQVARRLKSAAILERGALEALGAHFTNVTSSETAKDVLRYSRYNLVISDMSRADDRCATVASAGECAKCEPYRLLEWINTQLPLP